VSAVGVGVGVDFAIYLYSRCVEEYGSHSSLQETITTATKTTGEAIVYTGLTIIIPVLTWYFISGLKFQAEMGFFLAMIMTTNMVAALTLHPLLLMVVKPKFISRGRVSIEEGTAEVADAVVKAG
jgi:predicted RND superfamily exporter protein